MRDQDEYPYRVDYLHNLTNVKKLPGSEIRNLVSKMMQRLSETRTKHRWSTDLDVAAILIGRESIVHYASVIYFATEEDMLAFRLTWGIHT